MHNPESDHDSLRDLVRQSTNLGLPMGALHALAELKIRLRECEMGAIDAARMRGATWADIARALRISRQALHQRISAASARREPAAAEVDHESSAMR